MSAKTITRTVAATLAITLCVAIVEANLPIANATTGGKGLIVPIYNWDSGYEKLIDAKKAHPLTSIIAILNPNNGPGGGKDEHWTNVVHNLQNAGVKVIGYVATGYAGVSQDSIKAQIDNYYSWYNLNGVFLDEVSPDNHDYYKDLANYAKSSNISSTVVLNPGASVPSSYSDAADVIIIFENAYSPSGVDTNGIDASKLGVLVYGVSGSGGVFDSVAGDVKYMYAASDWGTVADDVVEQASR